MLIGTAAGGLQGRAPSCVAFAWGRVLLVSQHRFPLGLRD